MFSLLRYRKLVLFGTLILIFVLSLASYLYLRMKRPPEIRDLTTIEFYSANGTKYFELFNNQTSNYTDLEDISPFLIDAMLAVEDKDFYSHFGLNPLRIAKALWDNALSGEKKYGASTITQQYARNLYLSFEKTYRRKLQEAYYALLLEAHYSKDDILEGYLNTIYFGHGIYGVGDATRYYFNKDPKDLSLKEASILTAIIRAPTYYSPLINPEENEKRSQMILQLMLEQNRINKQQLKEAETEIITYYGRHPQSYRQVAPYFQDLVTQELEALDLVPDDFARGIKVYTSLDLTLHRIIEEGIYWVYPAYSEIETAVYAIEPNTGFVRAVIGGRNYDSSQFNRATQSLRQPGSAIKPLIYYKALEHGFTPSTTLRSEPTTFYLNTEPFTPQNYNQQYLNKKISLAYALATSDNIYAVKTHLYLGDEAVIDTFRRFGLTTPIEPHPSLALGINEVKLSELTTAYCYLASYGREVIPKTIMKVTTLDDEVLYEADTSSTLVLDPDLSFVMTDLLTNMFDRQFSDYASRELRVTGYSLSKELNNTFSGKSGLTNHDNWMIGYNPKLVLGIWTGYDSHQPILPYENGYSKQLWGYVMKRYFPEPVPFFQPTEGVQPVRVNPLTGKLATRETPYSKTLYYKQRMVPYQY